MDLPPHIFLDEKGLAYTKLAFPPGTEKGAANVAQALGCKPSQMVKTLIFETGDGEHVLVMLAADKNAISGQLKKAIGSRNIKLAEPETVKRVTGYEIGSIPPFHWQPQGFRSFIDAALTHEDILGVGAGVWGQEIMITPHDLAAASAATVVNLTDRGQPVMPREMSDDTSG
ncbi:MAG: YbaK/EbsC family protein [Chloroflexi bacterium]|nr:YbaK/EbsC family protein [Chloroflexota bacterium]